MVRKYFFLIVFSFCGFISLAQEDSTNLANDFVELANETYFNTRAIIQANELYVQAADYDPTNVEANYMAGRTFLETIFKSKATEYLLRVLEMDSDYKFNLTYMIGQSLQYALEFERAIEFYNRYKSVLNQQPNYRGEDYTSTEEVNRRIIECRNGIDFVNNPKNYEITPAGPLINSQWDDFAPVLNAEETMMVFTTRRQDGNLNEDVFDDLFYYEDIFISTKENGEWTPAQNMGEVINTSYHESNLALSADGSELYIYRDVNQGDIYFSQYRPDGSWSKPEPVESINSSFTENSMSLSPDGMVAFFSSDRPTTLGGLDIYYTERDSRGEWGAASNLGPAINTPYDEDGPFIDYDGRTLYFSSKGHKGMGGYDIFKSEYDSATQTWSEPVNLGYPLNTPDNDIYFVSTLDGERGYYASAREDGLGFTDIYHVRLANLDEPSDEPVAQNTDPEPEEEEEEPEPEPEETEPEPQPEPNTALRPVTLMLKVVDENTRNEIDANVNMSGAEGVEASLTKIGLGLYRADFLNELSMQYQLEADAVGYSYKDVTIEIPAASSEERTLKRLLVMEPLERGYSQILRNIYFDYGKAKLKQESFDELEKLRNMLASNPNVKVEIAGHTDSSGPKDFNKNLSQNRAQAVVDYLVSKGINRNRLIAKGYGESEPLASNDDERDGRELNRRVEFEVLSN